MRLFIILLIVLGFILAPVMMLRPSPAQKRKERLRAFAREKGVHFSLRNLPKLASDAEAPEAMPVYFIAPQKASETKWLLQRTSYEHEAHFLGWWQWQGEPASAAEQEVLARYIPRLPASVKAMGGGGQGISVYWDESGGEDQLASIIELIEALRSVA